MRKELNMLLSLMLALLMTGCAAGAEERIGEAEGYGGPLQVAVTMNGEDITMVRVVSHRETEGVGTRAIDVLPDLIAREDSIQVDGVSGATVTSEAIKAAVAQAMGMPMDMAPAATEAPIPQATPAMSGVGMAATGRIGPGTAEEGQQVYSFNVVFASADFDESGRILALDVDQLEVLSSQFPGFPSATENEQDFLAGVKEWVTKGAKGDDYMLGSGSWRRQMDAYAQQMVGMTMEEINEWYAANFSTETGKPVDNAPDGVTGATMSLRDEHGDILTAIQRAWEDAQRDRPGTGTGTDLPSASPAPEGNAPADDEAMPTDGAPLIDTNTETPADDESFG